MSLPNEAPVPSQDEDVPLTSAEGSAKPAAEDIVSAVPTVPASCTNDSESAPPAKADRVEHKRELQHLSERITEMSLSAREEEPATNTSTIGDTNQRFSTPPPPPPKDDRYLDPTPKTPLPSAPPSRSHSTITHHKYEDGALPPLPTQPGATATEPEETSTVEATTPDADESRSEIQSILDQFEDEGVGGPTAEEVMSPRLKISSPLLSHPIQHPPRRSSLEPILNQAWNPLETPPPATIAPPDTDTPVEPTAHADQSPSITSPSQTVSNFTHAKRISGNTPATEPPSGAFPHAMFKPPFPEPDPEPDLPFDFHRFLEQLRHRTADPVAKFLRSFLSEFGKKQWMVHEQVKIISDFLAFITDKMAQCEIWREVSDAEFDNAKEGMEKLVMNRLYTQTFSPAIPPPQPLPGNKGKRRQADRVLAPGRRGQHQEDVERDEVLAQKVLIYGWVQEEHLDIKPVGESGRRFLTLAQQELLKIKTYRAPRDKVICVLNCCKVIFGLLRNSKADQSADSFVPLLIYVVLHANPEHLVSNLQYIMRFRNQEKLGGEAGYYLSSLMGAVHFIESLDRTSLTVSDEVFEKNVEVAVSSIAERLEKAEPAAPMQVQVAEKSTISRPEVTSRNSLDAEYSTPRRSTSSREDSDVVPEPAEEKMAVVGLLRTIQRPLSTFGRIFSDDTGSFPPSSSRLHTPSPAVDAARSPSRDAAARRSPRRSYDPEADSTADPTRSQGVSGATGGDRGRLSAEDAAARQASAEAEEAQRIRSAEHATVVETLSGMFPDLDKEVIDDVVRLKEGRYVPSPSTTAPYRKAA
ncbi:MAG: hypothetical protein M1838_003414 [Thelocarpon superellum]|nr:MAG: hypothetical protein M1838_003414 [Thelocarpon superellum]